MNFQQLLNQGLSFFKSSKSGENAASVIGIDIGSSSIKVVQLRKEHGKAILETYGAIALGPYGGALPGQVTNLDSETTGKALLDLMREASVTTLVGGLSIPSSSSLVFTMDLPASVPASNYATVVPTEARKYIPVPISEVSIDFWPIPQRESVFEGLPIDGEEEGGQKKTEVLVAAIQNDALSRYNEIVKKAAVTPEFFEIEIFSNIRANFNRELSAVLVIDLGASKTKVSIVEYGVVREFHIVNRGAQDITGALAASLAMPFGQAEEVKKKFGLVGNPEDKNVAEIIGLQIDYIFSEIEMIELNFAKKSQKTISKIILTGGGALLKGIKEKAVGEFKCEVIFGDPFSKVEAPAFLVPTLSATGPEFATALGLAIRNLE